jgi:hypothetical protein
MSKASDDSTAADSLWDDWSDMSLSCNPATERPCPPRRRRGSIMKTLTLDESVLSSNTSNQRRSSTCRMPVSFDIVEIREHPIILDEGRAGPSLTIDWESSHVEVTTVQEYEITRDNGKVTLLSPAQRVAILMNAGYSREYLCDHFVGTLDKVEDEAAKKEAHPKKQPKQGKTMYSKIKKAAKSLKRQVSNTSLTPPESTAHKHGGFATVVHC